MRSERKLLEEGNFTWREHSQEFAALKPAREHLTFGGQDTAEQILKYCPDLEGYVQHHDQALSELTAKVKKCWEGLSESAPLRQLLAQAMERYPIRVSNDTAEQLAPFVAEYVVNSAPNLPDNYSLHTVWNQFRAEFLALRENSEIGPLWQDVEAASKKLDEMAWFLHNELEDLREEISASVDVPIAS